MNSVLAFSAIAGAFSDIPMGTKIVLIGILILIIMNSKKGGSSGSGGSGGSSSSGGSSTPSA